MKLTRLRIVGFKTFVEPTDFLIEPGLTGVVGPNGCGKSNLVEALRWVMGESSHKNLRASGMDDVIFAGSAGGAGTGGGRPSREHAEVMLAIDNAARTAPAAFNGSDQIEVSRRIAREAGSTYRVNGREVRARDVQLLFADAATGARSPAMVRQGQIAELIAAKPQARRRVLEDAAGIAGLHARRHEAELRLKAAEDNLVRVEDVLGAIDAQVEGLRRQARGAGRYRTLSAEIRRLEALLLLIAHGTARAEAAEAERAVEAALVAVADAQTAQAKAAIAQAVAAASLPALREAETAAAREVQRLALAGAALDAEERRAKARAAELGRHRADLERDAAREAAAREDAAATLDRLAREAVEAERIADERDAGDLDERAEAAEAELAVAEAGLARAQTEAAEAGAQAAALARALAEARERAGRLASERTRVAADLDRIGGPTQALDAPRAAFAAAESDAAEAEAAATASRVEALAARAAEAEARPPLSAAEAAAARLETEARTLAKLVAPASARFPPVLDAVRPVPGHERALAAALGDDLDAALDARAPAHWAGASGTDDPPLPEGATPLADHVEAPPELARRLRQIGIVAREAGAALRGRLRPGQRLVSPEGDLWRWDGLTQAAEAPSPAARRLAERNRLGALTVEAAAAREAAASLRTAFAAIEARARAAAAAEASAIDRTRRGRGALDAARAVLTAAERRAAEEGQRRAALAAALARVEGDEAEAAERVAVAETARADAPPTADLDHALQAARTRAAAARAEAAEARGALLARARETEARQRRAAALIADRVRWGERAERAERAGAELAERLERVRAEERALAEAPETWATERRRLQGRSAEAEAARRLAADRLAAAETALAEGDRRARATLEALGSAREARAAAQAGYEGLARRVGEVIRTIAETLDAVPADLFALAGQAPGAPLPLAGAIEPRLAGLRAERERLGGVNLRADEELAEVESRRGGLAAERDDLTEAIRRLRGAIGGLNREGRERLLAAFALVDGHFRRLFTTLFGGGTAELTLVDSDDPLEAGLEILARPPGKKPQTMTLLSGGEQALTATALIFAIFLTNPSPVCVLDEVDAPLDDANVERYCDLLSGMARDTDTRFLVITHNPITMARMDRLFGVTMAERGVSQLVSVDLAGAERVLEAAG